MIRLETVEDRRYAIADHDMLDKLAAAVRLLNLTSWELADLIQRQHAAGREPSAALRDVIRDALENQLSPSDLADALKRAGDSEFARFLEDTGFRRTV